MRLLALLLVHCLGFYSVLSFHHASPYASIRLRSASKATLSMASDAMKWKSMISSEQDLDAASCEILSTLEQQDGSIKDYNMAFFYISSVYESSSFKYEVLFDQLKAALPGLKVVMGCTTGAPIGSPAPFGAPIEIEARAGLSLLLGHLGDDVQVSTFQVDKQEMIDYTRSPDASLLKNAADDGVVIMFATEMVKSNLPQFLQKVEKEEKSKILGAFASAVTSLHTPKIFIKDYSDNNSEKTFDKYTIGAVGVSLTGNIDLQTVVARSCLPVGPIFEVIDRDGREILTMSNPEKKDTEEFTYPLVALDEVLKRIPYDQSEALKRELLVGVVTGGSEGTDTFYGQKPLTFDPITGSITLSTLPGDVSYIPTTRSEAALEKKIKFQFCIRDTVSAQEDLLMAGDRLNKCLQNSVASRTACDTEGSPLACFMLGNMDRGNRMFRFQSWESIQLHGQLESLKLDTAVPIVGAFSTCAFGTVTNDAHNNLPKAYMMETDSMYGVLSKKLSTSTSKGSSGESESGEGVRRDICTAQELSKYNDECDTVIVTKRDPEAAAAVRVASMDYVIPEKSPQPSNVLESIVWDREQYVDRMRERFQMSKALLEATRSELKYPKRDFVSLFKKSKLANDADISQSDGKLSAIIEFNRATLNNGKIMDESLGDSDVTRLEAAKQQVCAFTASVNDIITNNADDGANLDPDIQVAAMGCHVDFGTFKGSYEDLENIRVSAKEYRTLGDEEIPVICNDFVLYAYQLFKAKSSGADALRLYASVLPVQEINYMMKIAKKINVAIIVVVNTKPQLLEVLEKVTDLEVLSISSRNMRLWKLAPGKAESILDDSDVRRILAKKRLMGEGAEYDSVAAGQGGLIVLQEGFSRRKEVNRAKVDPLVDGVVLSEELLTTGSYDLRSSVMNYLGQGKTSAQAEEDALFDPKSYGL